MEWLKEYRLSLKNVDAEEFLDIVFFRPLGFCIVKILYNTDITPNQYSLAALLSGIISSYFFYEGSFKLGSIFFLMFAVFDCCDGMLARMKKNGTEFGRVIDGVVDYVTNFIVYLSLAFGVERFIPEILGYSSFWIIIFAGLSKALHAIIYDHYLMEYLSYESGSEGFNAKELDTIKQKIKFTKNNLKKNYVRFIALKTYYYFTKLQANNNTKKFDSKEYAYKNLLILKMWSLIGPAPHILVLILSFLLMRPEWLAVYAIGFGNLWMVLMFIIQKKVNQNLRLVSV